MKRRLVWVMARIFTAMLVGPLLASTAHAQIPRNQDAWSFEEASGLSVADASGLNPGTLVGGAARTANGLIGRDVLLDGVDDYVSLGDGPSLERAKFTISVWIKRNGPQVDWARVFNKGGGSNAPWGSYKLEFVGASDDTVAFHVGFTDGTAVQAQNVHLIPDGQWTHLVGVYANDQAWLYMNGVLESTATTSPGKTILYDAVPLTLGAAVGYGFFKGEIDEAKLFLEPFSAGEVALLYNQEKPATQPPPPPPPTLTVTSPNTAVTWAAGSLQTISWAHTLAAGTTATVDLSRDNGATWTTLATGVANASGTGSLAWTVTGPATSQGRVRVTSQGATDTSDAAFNISVPSVTVTSPNTAVTWIAGSLQTIGWTHNLAAGTPATVELSRDNGTTWTTLATGVANGGGTGSYAWTVSGPATTQGRVRVTSQGANDTSDVAFSVTTPTLTVTSPNTAVSWATGSLQTINWSHNFAAGTPATVELSRDNGTTWTTLAASVANGSGTGSYAWTVTGPATAQGRVRVTSQGANDSSDAAFTIATPALTLTSPNTNVTWITGALKTITWTHNFGAGTTATIGMSRDNGLTWTTIATGVANGSTTGSYDWMVTGPAATQARIRVTSQGSTDASDVSFMIITPVVTVVSPNTAVTWMTGSLQTIRWTHNLTAGSTATIDVSRDNGATWGTVASGVVNASGTTNYAWTVTGPATTQGRVRVTAQGGSDTNDVAFTITTPALTMTNPNTAVTWMTGSLQTISWTHNFAAGTTSTLDLSRDNGATWTTIASGVANGSGGIGSYGWTVTGPTTTQARLRVTSQSLSDISDAAFSIATPALTVTSPNTGVTWVVGSLQTIAWTHNFGTGTTANIDLSRDNGVTWSPLVSNVATAATTGSYNWTATGPATTQAKIRVTSQGLNDVSDSAFTVTTSSTKSVTFLSTTTDFPNPDRGFYVDTDVSTTSDNSVYTQGLTLTRQYFRLDAYRNSSLPSSFLNQVTNQFNLARSAGVKLIPRFTYNFSFGGPDATRARIEEHIQQLTPILTANADVISSIEAGFIGSWGEWHTSTNGLDTDPAAKAAILTDLLRALPASRMVALRYPTDLQLLNGTPITAAEAFTSSDRARVGNHQDCFLASDPDDWGTWGRTGNTPAYDKAYIAENGRYAVVGGETCNPSPRASCANALSELEYMHWSYLNLTYEPTVIQGWKDNGCYDEIRRRLGYRYELMSATYTSSAARGSSVQLDFQIANVGYAAMFNARPVWVVLTSGSTSYAAQLSVDPRTWAAGTTTQVSQTIALPSNIATGTYTLSIWMPDQATSIRSNPQYAVRFANQNVWQATTGYNQLATDVVITP